MTSSVTPDMALCFCRSLRRASTKILKLYATSLAPAGLRAIEFALLAEIERQKSCGLSELADHFQLDRSALRYRLSSLERARFVATTVDSRDGRGRRVSLTEEGRAKLAEAIPMWEAAQTSFERALGVSEADALRAAANLMASASFAEAFGSKSGPFL